MRLVQTKQLEGNGIPYKSAQNICFEGDSFVRGIAFSNRLRHLADDIYHAEVEAGNSCLIVEDETHFTIWHQEPTIETVQATQTETALANTVQQFAQQFVATKQVKPLQPTLRSEIISRQQSSVGKTPIMTSKVQSQSEASQRSRTANRAANRTTESPTTQTLWRQPAVVALAKTSAISASPNSGQHVSAEASAPLNNRSLDTLPGSTSPRLRSVPNHGGVANEEDSNLTRVWSNLSKPGQFST